VRGGGEPLDGRGRGPLRVGACLHDPKLERRLARVTAPTLVLWGRQDGLVPLVYGERYRDRIPGARLEVIERCGHLPPIERPAEFAAAVLRFIAVP
jgi:pimeloyl-ACP methyl ester carboxylesterase